MPNPIKPKRSHTSSAQPTVADLAVNELAVNWTDGKLFTRSPSDSIVSWTLGGSGGGGSGLAWSSVPASSTATGTAGDIAYDANYFYTATAQNTWKRVALSAWLPDPYFAQVNLLLHCDGTGSTFVDSSGTPKTITAFGNVTQSGTQSRFGGKSAAFDGSGDYLSGPTIDLSTGDWVVEGWFRVSNGSAFQTLMFVDPGGASAGMHMHTFTDGNLYFNNSAAGAIGGGSVPSNTWFHVAGARSSGTIRLYLNGALIGSTGQTFGAGVFKVGMASDTSTSMSGFADEIRVTIGTDRGFNGSTITVPTEAFPNA